MLIELPAADEIDDLAITTPGFEVRKFEYDLIRRKADLNYPPCKGQIVLVIRGSSGIAFVRRKGMKAWNLPSARITVTEAIEKAPRRVASEECGVGLRSHELAGIYDVIWHYLDVSIKRLHFVYAGITDDEKCAQDRAKGPLEARFWKTIPESLAEADLIRSALADCSTK